MTRILMKRVIKQGQEKVIVLILKLANAVSVQNQRKMMRTATILGSSVMNAKSGFTYFVSLQTTKFPLGMKSMTRSPTGSATSVDN